MTEKHRPKLAIADKNPVIRSGLMDLIARDGRFEVAGAVPTGAAFLKLLDEKPVDVGVIGWTMQDMTGGAVLENLKNRRSQVAIIVYTGEPPEKVLHHAIRTGARGFISKSDEPEVIFDTVSAVARGRLCFPYVNLDSLGNSPLDKLTSRERELLSALANGWSNLQIAARIGISENTVKYHLKNLYDKLDVNNRAMAVALYMSQEGA